MKGVILAGGLGSRLYPLTKITNKHLLPVYDQPMVFYPLYTLVSAGIKEVIIVTGGIAPGDFMRLLTDGSAFGLKRLDYTYQEKEGGIAHALRLCEEFIGDDRFVVILGDNILDGTIKQAVKSFENEDGAKVILKEVPNPSDYGVAVVEGNRIKKVIEKPKVPPTNFAVIGVYMYTPHVFKIIRKLKPSKRGELEISDVNDWYAKKDILSYSVFDGWWGDAGVSMDTLLQVNNYVAKRKKEAPHHWSFRNAGESSTNSNP